jgi:hypothetical protein
MRRCVLRSRVRTSYRRLLSERKYAFRQLLVECFQTGFPDYYAPSSDFAFDCQIAGPASLTAIACRLTIVC